MKSQALFGHLRKESQSNRTIIKALLVRELLLLSRRETTPVYFLTSPEFLLRDVLPSGVLFTRKKIALRSVQGL